MAAAAGGGNKEEHDNGCTNGGKNAGVGTGKMKGCRNAKNGGV